MPIVSELIASATSTHKEIFKGIWTLHIYACCSLMEGIHFADVLVYDEEGEMVEFEDLPLKLRTSYEALINNIKARVYLQNADALLKASLEKGEFTEEEP